jgi:hypothetical protein
MPVSLALKERLNSAISIPAAINRLVLFTVSVFTGYPL